MTTAGAAAAVTAASTVATTAAVTAASVPPSTTRSGAATGGSARVSEFFVPPSRFARPETTAVSAQGTRITFADGTEALCATSGLWNCNLGYGNEAIATAIGEAARQASYLTLFRYGHAWADRAAAALLDSTAPHRYARVVFSTAGGAALDTSLKIVRQVALARGTARSLVVSLRGSYHGLTFGAMGLTGEDLQQSALGVDQRLVRQVSPDDPGELDRLLAAQGSRVGAVVLEPVLGSGTRVVDPAVVELVLRRRDELGYLVVADEVATGFGRTGPMFASGLWPAQPDLLVASKGLTNGTCAASAVLLGHQVAADLDAADVTLAHGETQAGSPVSCAAMLATLAEFDRLDALAGGRRVADRLATWLEEQLAENPLVGAVTGRGCFRSLVLRAPDGGQLPPDVVADLVTRCRRHRVVVHPGPSCLQLVPALTYRPDDLEVMLSRVENVLRAAASESR